MELTPWLRRLDSDEKFRYFVCYPCERYYKEVTDGIEPPRCTGLQGATLLDPLELPRAHGNGVASGVVEKVIGADRPTAGGPTLLGED